MLLLMLIHSSVSAIERRTEQFSTEFGYLTLPLPYAVPGAGMGFGFLGRLIGQMTARIHDKV